MFADREFGFILTKEGKPWYYAAAKDELEVQDWVDAFDEVFDCIAILFLFSKFSDHFFSTS
jgi:hypothetical protein